MSPPSSAFEFSWVVVTCVGHDHLAVKSLVSDGAIRGALRLGLEPLLGGSDIRLELELRLSVAACPEDPTNSDWTIAIVPEKQQ